MNSSELKSVINYLQVCAGEMGKPTKQFKQMEALFVPNRRGSLEFAGVVEASHDQNCDIHGRRGSGGSVKRDLISSTATATNNKRDSINSGIGTNSKRDSVDGLFGNSYLSNYTVLRRGESIDRDLVTNGDSHPVVHRRRSSGAKTAEANSRYESSVNERFDGMILNGNLIGFSIFRWLKKTIFVASKFVQRDRASIRIPVTVAWYDANQRFATSKQFAESSRQPRIHTSIASQ